MRLEGSKQEGYVKEIELNPMASRGFLMSEGENES